MRVTSGGAILGNDISVRVGILRSDSPHGVISFTQSEITVLEAKYNDDPGGQVHIDVYRLGTIGLVTVDWRLAASAVHDFVEPLLGSLTFGPVSFQRSNFINNNNNNNNTLI